jgi:hypothetical protein
VLCQQSYGKIVEGEQPAKSGECTTLRLTTWKTGPRTRHARPCLRGRRKRGQKDQALGRSRGGFSTKIHLKVDLDGLPLALHLTGGEASDCRNFEVLLDVGPDVRPRAAITDKRYDSKANRDGARRRGICAQQI